MPSVRQHPRATVGTTAALVNRCDLGGELGIRALPSRARPLLPRMEADERAELVRLRAENKRLQMEREILKKAAAFFAKENT